MKALVLAAGYATRLYPLTLHTPKPLLPIGGRPILDHIVDKLEAIKQIHEIIIVTNHRFIGAFDAWNRERPVLNVKRSVLDDGTETDEDKLGAIGDISWTIDHMGLTDGDHAGEDLLVIAGDNLYDFELQPFADYFEACGKDCLLVRRLDDREELKRMGVAEVDAASGIVLGFEEKPAELKSDLAAFALYLYRRDTLPLFRRYLEEGNKPDAPGYFPEWLCRRRELRAFFAEGDCFDIGTPEAYREARERYA